MCPHDRRARALRQALLMFRLLAHGFCDRDLRGLLGKSADDIFI